MLLEITHCLRLSNCYDYFCLTTFAICGFLRGVPSPTLYLHHPVKWHSKFPRLNFSHTHSSKKVSSSKMVAVGWDLLMGPWCYPKGCDASRVCKNFHSKIWWMTLDWLAGNMYSEFCFVEHSFVIHVLCALTVMEKSAECNVVVMCLYSENLKGSIVRPTIC